MRNRLLAGLLLCATGTMTMSACAGDPTDPSLARPQAPLAERATADVPTRDVSPHTEGFVQANGTTLHYLDWGGTGPALVLITGLGENAHMFDDIAPKLASRYHVVALTRRGYGQSGRPATGYDVNTLVDDDMAVIDALHLDRVYLAAHSIGSQEMTRLAVRYPSRVARLAYVEGSLNDRSQSDACKALPKRGASLTWGEAVTPPPLTAADVASFAAFMRYQRLLQPAPWSSAVENSWRHAVVLGPDGSVVALSTDDAIEQQVLIGACHYVQEFSSLRAPSLAIGAAPGVIQDLIPWFPLNATGEPRVKAQAILAQYQHEVPVILAAFAAQAPNSSTLLIQNSNHYVFVRHQDAVLAALRAFFPARIGGEGR